MPPLTETDPEIRDSPVYWFFVLDAARDGGDFALAARAKAELERLGIRITYGSPRHRRGREETRHAD